MTPSELTREVLEVPRTAFVRLPDTQVIERPGWRQLLTPSLTQGGLNEVSLAVLEPGDADRVIDETLAMYAHHGLRFRWSVMPDSRPLDLPERLARHGLSRSDARAMYRGTTPLEVASGGVEVRQVATGEVDVFTRVMAEGWSMPEGPLRAVNDAMARLPHFPLFVAFIDGTPVGSSGMVLAERSAYLLGAVVLPAWRRRGVYRALVTHRLHVARTAGLTLATVHARADTSGRLLERLGFTELVRFPTFSNR